MILIGTGSELQLAFRAAEALEADGIPARVVSLPCWELFEQPGRGRTATTVLPPAVRARVAVEAGVSLGWERWVGDEGAIVGLDHFGASAPAGTIFERFGFTVDRVADVARDVLAGNGPRPGRDAGAGAPARAARRPSDARARRVRRRADVLDRPGPQLMRVAFAADHAGAALKDELLRRLAASDLGQTCSRPRRRRLRPQRRLPGLRRSGSATRSATARPTAAC